jgi:homoserine kinase
MNKTPFTVHVPASSANLGPGFDCLGLALGLWNSATFTFEKGSQLFEISGEGADRLPTDKTNLIYLAMEMLASAAGEQLPDDLHITCQHAIPNTSGLGSSAGAVICGLLAAREILDLETSDDDLLQMAIEMEGHGDNAGACLLGGLVLVGKLDSRFTFRRLSIDPIRGLVAVPNYSLSTVEARKALPEKIAYSQAIFNMSHVIDLIEVFYTGEYERLAYAMQDQIHQQYRFPLLPGAEDGIAAALESGAFGACLSGAGPSMIALLDPVFESQVGEAIISAYDTHGVKIRLLPLDISAIGAYVD